MEKPPVVQPLVFSTAPDELLTAGDEPDTVSVGCFSLEVWYWCVCICINVLWFKTFP